MKSDTVSAVIGVACVVILAASVYGAVQLFAPTPEPVVEVIEPEPKQSPYVIYIFVCDKLEAVIAMTEPPVHSDGYYDSAPSAEMLDLMFEAEIANRVLTFNGGLRFCPPPEKI